MDINSLLIKICVHFGSSCRRVKWQCHAAPPGWKKNLERKSRWEWKTEMIMKNDRKGDNKRNPWIFFCDYSVQKKYFVP
jgi:hypothetical protein